MTSGGGWSTRPFRPETLDAAREAARRSGLSLAQWLNSAVLDTAAEAGVHAGDRRARAQSGEGEDEFTLVGERLEELARRIDRLLQRGDETGPWETDRRPIPPSPESTETARAFNDHEPLAESERGSRRFADVIRDLNARLDRLAINAARPGDPPRDIARKLNGQSPNPGDGEAGLRSVLAEISARQRELDTEPAPAHDFSRLEEQLRHITNQIETLRRPAETAAPSWGADRTAFERIEARILDLAQKLDAADVRLDSIGAIERSIADLILEFKASRAAAIEDAERIARMVVGEALSRSEATGAEIDGLKHEFSDFRASQAEIDRRTEDALEALHGTLERVVDQLGTIETGIGRELLQEARFLSASRLDPGPIAAPAPPLAPVVVPGRHPFGPDTPADYPLEPGSGAPQGRGAASEALARPSTAEPAAKASFIAAARRAAQAAAAETPVSDPDVEPKAEPAPGGASLVANRRRALMIAAGVLLFGAGSAHLALNTNLLTMPGFDDSVRAEAARPASAESPRSTGAAPAASMPASPATRTAAVPNPIVPENGAPPARRPATAITEDYLLSPVPDSSLPKPPPTTPSASETVAAPPARSTDITGSVAPTQAHAASPGTAVTPRPEFPESLPEAIGSAALRSAALAGNPAAAHEIAVRYSDGRGVPQSLEEAARWFTLAADQGLAPAQYRLGTLYEKGEGVKKDLMEARRLYVAAAAQGNAKAMHNLAVLYAVGFDGNPDYKTASEWFRKAAAYGIADSQYNLGILYARGVGVEQNLSESYKWFALAAQGGDKDAGKKRDDVAARLGAQALSAARLAVQAWTAEAEPEKASKVELPADGPAPVAPARAKPTRRTGTSGSA